MLQEIYVLIPLIVILCAATFYLGWFMQNKVTKSKIMSADEQAKRIISEGEKAALNLKKEKLLEVRDEWYKKKQEFDNDVQTRKNKLKSFEKQLQDKEELLSKRMDEYAKKDKNAQKLENELNSKVTVLEEKEKKLENLIQEHNQRLENISGLTQDEAKNILMNNLIQETKMQTAGKLKEIRDEMKLEAKKLARNLIVQAIQRSAADHSVETTVSVLNIQSDELKGRIIGKEGRNVRAFEAATGVDIIVDDTPEAITISAFDPFRREVAKIAMERLIADGRIHPTRIEEVVEKVKKELEEEIIRVGENSIIECGMHGVHPELVRLVGRMKYRTSYGQNLLQHSIEVAHLCGIMAVELGLDPVIAKRAGLLHDVGKVVDREVEGPHAIIGYDLAKKFKEHPVVCNAIGAHHEDMEMETPIAVIVQACDAISGARPGARRESVEGYVKRLQKLEEVAKSFEGVGRTYAIQAGREVRVIVEHDKVSDSLADQLSVDIASKIQEEMEYPGQIKVTVIRERRSVAYAK
ncbi:MAG: ribonuclease Y [Chlorobi bacterium]|nr:ribonuclease Y [Chlorobiota bacterium]MCI0714960.1 ribonuclease Y [Chlorobiota bacterium]